MSITDELSKFIQFGHDGCWLWYGIRKPKNNPLLWHDGRRQSVRLVLAQELGMTPAHEQLGTPTCGNSRCVNPSHLQPLPARLRNLKPMAGPTTPSSSPTAGETAPEAGR